MRTYSKKKYFYILLTFKLIFHNGILWLKNQLLGKWYYYGHRSKVYFQIVPISVIIRSTFYFNIDFCFRIHLWWNMKLNSLPIYSEIPSIKLKIICRNGILSRYCSFTSLSQLCLRYTFLAGFVCVKVNWKAVPYWRLIISTTKYAFRSFETCLPMIFIGM